MLMDIVTALTALVVLVLFVAATMMWVLGG
jgi:hypothetical protein